MSATQKMKIKEKLRLTREFFETENFTLTLSLSKYIKILVIACGINFSGRRQEINEERQQYELTKQTKAGKDYSIHKHTHT